MAHGCYLFYYPFVTNYIEKPEIIGAFDSEGMLDLGKLKGMVVMRFHIVLEDDAAKILSEITLVFA
jgi:hypothetical protein